MAHSLTPGTPPPISLRSEKKKSDLPSLDFQRVRDSHKGSHQSVDHKLVHRRSITLGLSGLLVGLGLNAGDWDAIAARRPPAPPPEEKPDLNVSGVVAKVLASKKRKEAMKAEMAKLRERGKPINE